MQAAILLATGYFAGSIPFGVLVTRWLRGVDVRASGSGNIGATNVARVAGKGPAMGVLVLDALKGALPVVWAMKMAPNAPLLHSGVALAAFLGHVFPIWLRFRGGKGVATAVGVVAVLAPWAALSGFAVYASLFAAFRISSVGSLGGAIAAVTTCVLLDLPWETVGLVALLFGLILLTHRGNIARLVKRREKAL